MTFHKNVPWCRAALVCAAGLTVLHAGAAEPEDWMTSSSLELQEVMSMSGNSSDNDDDDASDTSTITLTSHHIKFHGKYGNQHHYVTVSHNCSELFEHTFNIVLSADFMTALKNYGYEDPFETLYIYFDNAERGRDSELGTVTSAVFPGIRHAALLGEFNGECGNDAIVVRVCFEDKVPEPATTTLAFLALAGLLSRRRRPGHRGFESSFRG